MVRVIALVLGILLIVPAIAPAHPLAEAICEDIEVGRSAFGYVVPNGDRPLGELIAKVEVGIAALNRARSITKQAGVTAVRLEKECLEYTDQRVDLADDVSIGRALVGFHGVLETLKCLQRNPHERFDNTRSTHRVCKNT